MVSALQSQPGICLPVHTARSPTGLSQEQPCGLSRGQWLQATQVWLRLAVKGAGTMGKKDAPEPIRPPSPSCSIARANRPALMPTWAWT